MSADDDDDDEPWEEDAVVEMEIGDELDLHTFAPRDVKSLVEDYLGLAADKGFREVRIVHGKGTGALRRTVHAVLEKHPLVEGFTVAGEGRGSWGAPVVKLRRPPTVG
jgi:dsDNA-specific endonuclease/ATPase MutS2